MGITAISGPHVVYGVTQNSTGGVTEYNEQRAPSLYDLGTAFADPRANFSYRPGGAVSDQVYGIFNSRATVDAVVGTTLANNVVASQAPVTGTALTLNTTGSGVTQTTIVAPEDGSTVSVLCLGSTAATLTFGSADTVALWNPAAAVGRCLSVATNSSENTGTLSIAGRDIYGYKMTESISILGSSAAVFTQKAYKYVSNIVLTSTTIVSTGITVGVSSIFGLPIVATYSGVDTDIRLIFTSSLVSANSSGAITVASTVTATSTTGDVRGTYGSSTALSATARLQIAQHITAAMVAATTASDTSAIFGVTQYSSV
jgi:hypothetical protein